ncbi:Protein REVERSION-TO-ETHYLENE SENSITIVITY1 [Hibiscus syriacus]|uniref:Protein REVERSION-TO-ETHYLENE SENSITIVITY1 n=1 Tax=Hibiscus syriacus TaxID=106335 RepID=A0A6A3BCJ1_HIBSY|nr:protein REVERSION-TO-ETHYLENE SENSITIVITY1-like [Hibiscus syriacus]XP_038991522.1 protein REVERSION-TO-ETHYLENE SENSITIVITY1-like [Hibiscus syriacus]XP_038991523.1 protein REVERSION-TO-ETHYLENE SENSITIVITY1-like [Hibiscus syriacus]XP_038991524.1 protein REVERSION-TO-ETHYLENE SENSITIVITY1-like [Hibiscus syriacus]KAE8712509.1 Protein REVERSION-TO-ETHYLENE SENSITIVITY1 [Hibiscus syriacus]
MPRGRLPMMDLKRGYDVERDGSRIQHDLWPLDEIDPKNAKFPCCLVWTPLPVVSWLAPFIGHVGICLEAGAILDFSGSYFVNIEDFAFGAVARYVQLDREKCCFPPNLAGHTCKHGYQHTEYETALTWDDALQSSVRYFEHKSYNLFTCNSYSFVANCLNRLCYDGSMNWNMISVAVLLMLKGQWVDTMSIVRSFLPFTVVLCLGLVLVGWPFMAGLFSFSLLLLMWFLLGTYCAKTLLES